MTATSGPKKVELPVIDDTTKHERRSERESPPASGPSREAMFPPVDHGKLANGMGLDVVSIRALPIVQVRLLVHAGSNFGGTPGLGEITASMLKDGGTRALSSAEVLRRIETLGADLTIRSEPDATVLSLALTKDKLGEGLALLSQIVREPRFDAEELRKLKARSIDEISDALRSNGAWTVNWLVFHELFPAQHPYRAYAALPSQIAKIGSDSVRDFHRQFYVPKNATLVLAGDIDDAAAKDLAQKHFGAWTGSEAPKVTFPSWDHGTRGGRRVLIAHRPKSVQSDVDVVMLAPARKKPGWARVRVANHILGGGVASRLFDDVRERRSLAYRTNAQILELAHGDQPLVAYAGTESSKTAQAAMALLENVHAMKTAPPTADETDRARRYLSDVFAIRMETIGSIADMVVTQETFALPDRYWDTYRAELRAADGKEVADEAASVFGDPHLLVVAGDADAIAPELTRFGDVTVYDPEKEFNVTRTLPAGANK